MSKLKYANSRGLTPADIALIKRVRAAVGKAGFRPMPPEQAEEVMQQRRAVASIRERRNPHYSPVKDD